MKIKTIIVSALGQYVAFDEHGQQIAELSFSPAEFAKRCQLKGHHPVDAKVDFISVNKQATIFETRDGDFNYDMRG